MILYKRLIKFRVFRGEPYSTGAFHGLIGIGHEMAERTICIWVGLAFTVEMSGGRSVSTRTSGFPIQAIPQPICGASPVESETPHLPLERVSANCELSSR